MTIQYWPENDDEAMELQPCGHPVTDIVQARDGTAYCKTCAELACTDCDLYKAVKEGTAI